MSHQSLWAAAATTSPPPAPVPTMPRWRTCSRTSLERRSVITSPGSAVNKTVAVTVRGSSFFAPKASVGDLANRHLRPYPQFAAGW